MDAENPYIWRTGAFAGEFGDAYVQNTNLEGGIISNSIKTLLSVFPCDELAQSNECELLQYLSLCDTSTLETIQLLFAKLKQAAELDEMFVNSMHDDEKLSQFFEVLLDKINSMECGAKNRIILIGGWYNDDGGHGILHAVERDSEDSFAFVVSNTGDGLEYHPCKTSEFYPKTKFLTTIRISNIPKAVLMDGAFWLMLYRLRFTRKEENKADMLYEILLPHLCQSCTFATPVKDQIQKGMCSDWETAQRSGTCSYRCILSMIRYAAKVDGLSKKQVKQLMFAIRVSYINKVKHDIDHLRSTQTSKEILPGGWKRNDVAVVKLGCSQTGVAAVKEAKRGSITETILATIQSNIACILDLASQLQLEHGSSLTEQTRGLPSNLWNSVNITSSFSTTASPITSKTKEITLKPSTKMNAFNNFSLISDSQSIDKFAGSTAQALPDMFIDFSTLPVAFSNSKKRCTTIKEIQLMLTWAIAKCSKIRVKTIVSATSLAMRQIIAVIERTIADRLPIPSVKKASTAKNDPWINADITLAEQRSICKSLLKVTQELMASLFSLPDDRILEAKVAILNSAILACFDAIIRCKPSDSESVLTNLLRSYPAKYKLLLRKFNLDEFDTTSASFLLISPSIIKTRCAVTQYFNATNIQTPTTSTTATANNVRYKNKEIDTLFEYETRAHIARSDTAQFKMGKSDATYELIHKILVKLSFVNNLPPKQKNDALRDGLTETIVKRVLEWTLCSWQDIGLPEISYYRDVIFLTKLSLESLAIFRESNEFFKSTQLISPNQILPQWTVGRPLTPQGMTYLYKATLFNQQKLIVGLPNCVSPTNINYYISLKSKLEDNFGYAKTAMQAQFLKSQQLEQDKNKFVSEDDIVFAEKSITDNTDSSGYPTFDNLISAEESRQLFSIVSASAISIPLILEYFADVGRIGWLINKELQAIIESVLFQPLLPVNSTITTPSVVQIPIPEAHRDLFLRTNFGLLANELHQNAEPVLELQLLIVKQAVSLCYGSYTSVFVDAILFVLRICCRICSIHEWLQTVRKQPQSPTLHKVQEQCTNVIIPRLQLWISQAEVQEDLTRALTFHSHLAMIHAQLTGDIPAFLLSASYVVSWHGKNKTVASSISKLPADASSGFGFRSTNMFDEAQYRATAAGLSASELFYVLELKRDAILEWAAQTTQAKLNSALNRINIAALQKHSVFELSTPLDGDWQPSSGAQLSCKKIVQNESHNYYPSTDFYEHVSFPEAPHIALYFDPRCSTEGPLDYVTIFKDATCTSFWGKSKYFGKDGWPGANGNPPLLIPKSSCYIHFHSASSSDGDWGFLVTIVAPISTVLVNKLMEQLQHLAPDPVDCQFALATSNCNFEQAKKLLEQPIVLEKIKKQNANTITTSSGLYSHSSNSGSQINLQTAEVYLLNRTLMPIPMDIASHADFYEVFEAQALRTSYCALLDNRENRKWVEIATSDNNYEIFAWQPADIVTNTSLITQGLVPAFPAKNLLNFPRQVIKPSSGTEEGVLTGTYVLYDNISFVPVSVDKILDSCRGESNWFERLLSVSLQETFGSNKATKDQIQLWRSQEHFKVLMYVQAKELVKGVKRGTFFEIQGVPEKQTIICFELIEQSRKLQRKAVFTSDQRFCLTHAEQDSKDRTEPWPSPLLQCSGNLLGSMANNQACDQTSLQIFRACKKQHVSLLPYLLQTTELQTTKEEYIAPRCLQGIVPEVLLESFQFWRRSPSLFLGYLRKKECNEYYDWFKGSQIVIQLAEANSSQHCSAIITRIPLRAKEQDNTSTGLQQQKNQPMRLLNLASCSNDDNPLGLLCRLLTKLDSISHILVWSTSIARLGDEAEVSYIEFPRIQATFALKSKLGAAPKLMSLDHEGYFVSFARHESIEKLVEYIPHATILENKFKELFLMVPNYGIKITKVTNCPFDSHLYFDKGPSWYNRVGKRFFLYPLHASGAFIRTTSLSSTLYLIILRLFKKEYELASGLISAASFSDIGDKFTTEQQWILSLLANTKHDWHPSAHACRLRLIAACAAADTNLTYQLSLSKADAAQDYSKYLVKFEHVATVCRLSVEEEATLLSLYLLDAEATAIRKEYLAKLDVSFKSTNAQQMTVKSSAPKKVGWVVRKMYLLVKAAFRSHRAQFGAELGYYYKYERPASITAKNAITVLKELWNDDIDGFSNKTGFLLLYELLIGTITIQPTKFDTANLRTVHSFVKLVLQSLFLKLVDKSPVKELKFSQACYFKTLVPLLVAIEADINFGNNRNANAFPKVPYAEEQALLLAGIDPRSSPAFLDFERKLVVVVEDFIAGQIWASVPYLYDFLPAFSPEPTATVQINNEVWRYSRPDISNTTADSFKLIALSLEEDLKSSLNQVVPSAQLNCASLDFSFDELSTFATQPLASVVCNYITMEPTTSEVLTAIPDSIQQHPKLQSTAAKGIINRIAQDISFTKEATSTAMVPKLCCLTTNHLKTLRSLLIGSTTSEESTSDLLRSTSLDTNSSKLLQAALYKMGDLINVLSKLQSTTATEVLNGVPAVECFSNILFDENNNAVAKTCFSLLRAAGQATTFNFELLCSSLLADSNLELRKMNPFISSQQVELTSRALVGVVLKCLKLSQVNKCIANTAHLYKTIKKLLKQNVEGLFVTKQKGDLVPTSQMISSALTQNCYEEQASIDSLAEMIINHSKLEALIQNRISADNQQVAKHLAAIVLHFHDFDLELSTAFAQSIEVNKLLHLLDLSERKCYYNGKPLLHPSNITFAKASSSPNFSLLDSTLADMINVLEYTSNSLAVDLSAKRHYVSVDAQNNTISFDPRYLMFEFTSNFLLRKRQVELVADFIQNLAKGVSSVQQMIMGAGKTTVICPLLSLLLADGENLVVQIVPPALLEMSKSIMQQCFSTIIRKRVYSIEFERSNDNSSKPQYIEQILKTLTEAKLNRGVICTTPEVIKSLFLKLIELEDVSNTQHTVPAINQEDIKNASTAAMLLKKVISLFNNKCVALLDEVDLLLHPLKSELNFPIGARSLLQPAPLRWQFAIHILDAVFYFTTKSCSYGVVNLNEREILEEIVKKIEEGVKAALIQTSPHVILLQQSFYQHKLKPLFAKWALVWLQHQNTIKDDLKRIHKESSRLDSWNHISNYISQTALTAGIQYISNNMSPGSIQLLNLCKDWVCTYLPHCLSKINRVTFGLLDTNAARKAYVTQPKSRLLLAVPFVGKDVPAPSSEFAHPDILIGLTILAYRYEGLRDSDIKKLLTQLKNDLTNESGLFNARPSSILFNDWLRNVDSCAAIEEILPLELQRTEDSSQITLLHQMLYKKAEVIHYYLEQQVFTRTMKFQEVKIQASGFDIGSDLILEKRVGFSGTPSSILPYQLGDCIFEKTSEAKIMSVLSHPKYVQPIKFDNNNWTVDSLLHFVANHSPPLYALIDAGALITGLNNEQVARQLLKEGLAHVDAVVFLDNNTDQKMVVDRSNYPAVLLSQSGISTSKRFTFYDQVHTTGMDIKQPIVATALVTLGKDMTFRDYAQACWRMRGLGRGQTIKVLLIREVLNLVHSVASNDSNELTSIIIWLLLNTINSEQMQKCQLFMQTIASEWRKKAFKIITAADNSITTQQKDKHEDVATELPSQAEIEQIIATAFEAETCDENLVAHLLLLLEDKQNNKAAIASLLKTLTNTPTQENLQSEVTESSPSMNADDDLQAAIAMSLMTSTETTTLEQTEEEGKSSTTTTNVVEAIDFNELDAAAQLKFCLELFKESVNRNIDATVPDVQSLAHKMSSKSKQFASLLEGDSDKIIANCIDQLKQIEDSNKIAIQSLHYDTEMVQEREQEQEKQKEQQETMSAQQSAIAMPKTVHWQLKDLFQKDATDVLSKLQYLFYSMKSFTFSQNNKTLSISFPETLKISQNHIPLSIATAHNSSGRRIKDVNILLQFKNPYNSTAKVVAILVSLNEAEAIRYQLLKYNNKLINNSLSLYTLNGTRLSKQTTSNVNDEQLFQCAKFFNANLSYTNSELLLLLECFGKYNVAQSSRRAYLEEMLALRNRTYCNWRDADACLLFCNQNEVEFKKLNSFRSQIESKLLAKFSTLAEAFDYFDKDKDGQLSNEDFLQILQVFSLTNIDKASVAELMRRFDKNEDGLLSLAEFIALTAVQQETLDSYFSSSAQQVIKMLHVHAQKLSKEKSLVHFENISKTMKQAHTQLLRSSSLQKTDNKTGSRHLYIDQFSALGSLFVTTGGNALFSLDNHIRCKTGEYPTLMPRGVLLTSGKWYFEVLVLVPGNATIGWADLQFSGDSEFATGVGDDESSWGVNGYTCEQKHNNKSIKWDYKWATSDIICCLADVDNKQLLFCVNGNWQNAVEMNNIKYVGGLIPAISFESNFQARVNYGKNRLRFPLPQRSRSVYRWSCWRLQELVAQRAGIAMYAKMQCIHGKEYLEQVSNDDKHAKWPTARLWSKRTFITMQLQGLILTSGKWYYEVEIIENRRARFGFCDLLYSPFGSSGFGSDKHSWAYNGNSQHFCFNGVKPFGARWKSGDTIGCGVDVDNGRIIFSLNGSVNSPMGVAISGANYAGGFVPCFSMDYGCECKVNWGGDVTPLKYQLKDFKPISQAIDSYNPKESILNNLMNNSQLSNRDALTQSTMIEDFSLLTKFQLLATSGEEHVAINNIESICTAISHSPSIVANHCHLTSGKYFYEVTILKLDITKAKQCVIGFANAKEFFGNSVAGEVVGCTHNSSNNSSSSWGLDCHKLVWQSSSSTLAPTSLLFSTATCVRCAIDIEAKVIYYDLFNPQTRQSGHAKILIDNSDCSNFTPAISLFNPASCQINFGQLPFTVDSNLTVHDYNGFRPINEALQD